METQTPNNPKFNFKLKFSREALLVLLVALVTGVVGIFLGLSLGGQTYIYESSLPKVNTTQSGGQTSTTTVATSVASASTTSSSEEVTLTGTFQQGKYYPESKARKAEVTITAPKGYTLKSVEPKPGGGVIPGSNSLFVVDAAGKDVLSFGFPYEANLRNLTNITTVGNSAVFGSVVRAMYGGEYSTGKYGYTNTTILQAGEECNSEAQQATPPCGYLSLSVKAATNPQGGEDISFYNTCENIDLVSICDQIILSMKVKGLIY